MPAKKLNLDQADLVIAEPNTQLRRALREGIMARGFERVMTVSSFSELNNVVTEAQPDLVITDLDLPGAEPGAIIELVKGIRHNTIGDNPFVVIMAMVESPTEERVGSVVDAGVDAILVKPLAVRTMLDHITTLIRARKPFAITSDYIGPDRRLGPREDADRDGQDNVSTVEVPNSLSQKAYGTFDAAAMERQISETVTLVNEQKVVRNATLIDSIVRQIIPFYEKGEMDESVRIHIGQLIRVSQDIGRRIAGTEDQHVTPLCNSLVKVARAIEAKYLNPDKKDIELLKNLSAAILQSFQSGEAAARLSKDIADTVSSRRFKVG